MEKEKDTAKAKCKRLEKIMEKIVSDMTKHAKNANSQAGNIENTIDKILSAIHYNTQ